MDRSEYRKLLGKRLKMVRLEKELKQGDISKLFNISKGSVSEYENGKNEPPPSFLVNFGRRLGVDLVWLLEGGDQSKYMAEKPPPLTIHDEVSKSYADAEEIFKEVVDYLKSDRELLETVWHLVKVKKGIRNLKQS